MAEYKSCIVKDCTNRSDGGEFVGDLCSSCYEHLTTGKVGPTLSILRKIRDAELFILKGSDGKIVTQGQFNALVAENTAYKNPPVPVNYERSHEQTAKEINKALDKAGVKGIRAVSGKINPADLLETAWGIIANANGGNWKEAQPDWRAAAERWRDEYHYFLSLKLDNLMFAELRGPNMERCDKYFQTCKDWTISDWLMAITGELGELANVLKKIRRGDFTVEDKRGEIAKEIADVNIYLDLLSAKLGIDLGKAIREKFNEVSVRRQCPIKL